MSQHASAAYAVALFDECSDGRAYLLKFRVSDADDLSIEYSSGGYWVRPIDHLDVDIEDGELVLLLGARGCGKTTLLSALAVILTPSSGTIEVNGVAVTELSGRRLTDYRRDQVGVVFQAFNLVPSLSALEAGEVLLRQGDTGDYVYVVEAGTIELLRERVDGRPDVVGLCQSGQYFGEVAPLYGLRRSATARAVVPSRVVGCSATEFRQLRHELAGA